MRHTWKLVLVVMVLLMAACAPPETEGITFETLDGETVVLSDYEGQVVLVNFWATWCGPCRVEMPLLQAYYNTHKDDAFTMIAINAGEKRETVEEFLEEEGFTFPVALDRFGDVGDQFGGIRSMPTTIVYGPNGNEIMRHSGIVTESMLEEEVTPLIERASRTQPDEVAADQ